MTSYSDSRDLFAGVSATPAFGAKRPAPRDGGRRKTWLANAVVGVSLFAVLTGALYGLHAHTSGSGANGGGSSGEEGGPVLLKRDRSDPSPAAPNEDLFVAGTEYRSPGPHKVVVYDPCDSSSVKGFRQVAAGPGYRVGFVDELPQERAGCVEVRDDMNLVRLRKSPFDSTATEPEIPHEWKGTISEERRSLVLVQSLGPINDSWLAEVGKMGAEPLLYLPENAYVALASEESFRKLEESESRLEVQYVGLFHPFYAVDESLERASGETQVAFLLPPGREGADTARSIEIAAKESPATAEFAGARVVIALMDAAVARDVVRQGTVMAAQVVPEVKLFDEKSSQWMAGSRTPDRSDALLGTGYLAWYQSKGFGGDPGFAVEVADSGLTAAGTVTPSTVHPDLLGPAGGLRVVSAKNYTSDPTIADSVGHGTEVAGIVAGRNTGSGSSFEDSQGFNYGIGVDPEARLVISKVIRRDPVTGKDSLAADYVLGGQEEAYSAGARISNNSWGSASPTPEYDFLSFIYDAMTRDLTADPGRQETAFVFAAGNEGPGSQTISSPANAKNVVAVGSHENARPGWIDDCDRALGQTLLPNTLADDMDDISPFSARGPTADGRKKPDLVAPGIHVASHRVTTGQSCPGSPLPGGSSGYVSSTGTSFSAPHVAGQLSLLRRWFAIEGWKEPSPAMLKAYAVLGAVYLQGAGSGGSVPNSDQGFGAAGLDRLLTDTTVPLVDQSFVFTETGQQYEVVAQVVDPGRPVAVTLAYTDAPGNTVGASYVNDLDLEVMVGGNLYRGNYTSGEFSVPGGSADPRNNVERVLLPPGQSGPITVRVKAKNVAGDAVPDNTDRTDQDFALAVHNVGGPSLLTVERVNYSDLGDADGFLGGPEPFNVRAVVRNLGSAPAPSVSGTLQALSAGASLSVSTASFGTIAPGATATNGQAFYGFYEGTCTKDVEFRLTLTSGSSTYVHRFTIPTRPQPDAVAREANAPIPDGGSVETGMEVGADGSVLRVEVGLILDHVALGELHVTVRSPQGTEIVLSDRRGSSNRLLGADFSDEAHAAISTADQAVTSKTVVGTFRPEQSLAAFNGQSARGTWVVRVSDQVFSGGGNQGIVRAASISVTTGCSQPSCSIRPSSPVSRSYLAEGATAGGFDTWVLVANPSSSKVHVCLTFLTESGARPGPLLSLPPLSRKSVLVDSWVTTYNVATVVEGIDGLVLAERAMYAAQPGLEGAHAVKASMASSTKWFLAEGATSGPFETWVLVANPSASSSASVNITYMTPGGPVVGPSFNLPPQSRRSVRVDDTVDTYHVSTFVSSTGAEVVAERATYVAPGERRGATASPGVTAGAFDEYLAEGATAGGFETWVLVANPDPSRSASVKVRFITEVGPGPSVSLTLAPRSRQSVRANDYVSSFDVSALVESTPTAVVAERAMYFDHPGLGRGAASGEAVDEAGSQWVAVEGATAGGFETWILVSNPNPSSSVTVDVDFLSTGGVGARAVVEVPPLSRRSIRADDFITSYDVTTRVTARSGGQVIVERSTYTSSGPSRDATAGPAFKLA